MKIPKRFMLLMLGLFLVVGCSLEESTGPGSKPTGSAYKLKINEFMASNDAAVADPEDDGTGDGSPYDDWLEIYNADTVAIDIGGMYLSDDPGNLKAWQIPTGSPDKTTIPADSFLVLWADEEPQQGILHLDFKLKGSGESIVLVESNGSVVIDSYTFGPQQTDISMGRVPDGSDNWVPLPNPTPGASNGGQPANQPPEISNISVSPDTITAATPVTVSAEVTDPDDNLSSVTVTYGKADSITNSMGMTLTGAVYQAELGTFPDGTRIYFFITATDQDTAVTVSDTLSFEVGYVPPVLYINEFLASNDSCCADEYGEYDDWVEIYNPGPDPVDIGGMYITDDLSDLTAWQIPTTVPDSTTIQPNDFLVLWADKQPEQGILHVNIKLSSGGEQVGLVAPNGTTVIDSLTFGPQTTDVSYGRYPDGSDNWQTFANPTPGFPNQ